MRKWICNKCEAENEESARVCAVCGAKREFVQRAVYERPAAGAFPTGSTSSRLRSPAAEAARRPSSEELRGLIKKYDSQKVLFRVLIVLFVLAQYGLFFVPYATISSGTYTIFGNVLGEHGDIEQICSIVLFVICILPAIFCWISFKVRRRNLPITVSAFTAVLITVYCAVIWLGSDNRTMIPVCIALSSWIILILSILMVKALNNLDNAMYRPRF